MKVKKLDLEKGHYQEAKNNGLTFTEYLETLDPVQEHQGTPAEKLDAFERQLAAHGLKIGSGNACLAADFFKTSSSTVLFPEFVSRNVRLGMGRGKFEATLDEIAATTTPVDSGKYEGIEFDLATSDIGHKRTAEGAQFSKIVGKTKEKAINIVKIGRRIEATYEALSRVRANVLAVTFQAIGVQIGRDLVSEAIYTLINGDGNSNAASDVGIASSGTLTYADMLKLELSFDEGFESRLLIADKATMTKIMGLAEFKDALVANEWLKNGMPQTPFGNMLRINSGVAADVILALDPSSALELLEERGGSLVETDKLIDKQIENTVIAKRLGFNKLFTGASKLLDISP